MPDKAKFTVCSIIKLATIAFDETSSYWSAPKKAPNFSAFHWSPHGCLITIHRSAFRSHEGSTSTEKKRNKLNYRIGPKGPNLQLLQLCTAHTAWSDSDQAVRAVHSCISWLYVDVCTIISLWTKRGNINKLLGDLLPFRFFKNCQAVAKMYTQFVTF